MILHIVNDPGQISSPKTHHTVAILPIKQFAIHDLMVDIEGAASFELSDPVAHEQAGRHRGSQMNVIFYSAYGMENCILGFANLVLQVVMNTISILGVSTGSSFLVCQVICKLISL